ncbi:MAG: hypothetical protein KC503_08685 [Myxococcales bacterium]|nr:hypothetical protein [Myxococcales bacterium]
MRRGLDALAPPRVHLDPSAAGQTPRTNAPSGPPLYRRDPDDIAKLSHYVRRLRREKGNLVFRDTAFTAVITPDGSLRFDDKPNFRWHGTGATFDVTDAVLRALGNDPYGYEKRRFARATAALRVRMRRRFNAKMLRTALGELPHKLARLLRAAKAKKHPSALVTLRRLYFQLWDECLEGTHNARAKAATRARAAIERFIRRNLPAASRLGYTKAELRELNRKRSSKQRFEPYGR